MPPSVLLSAIDWEYVAMPEDFMAEHNRKQAELDASDAEAKAAGEIVGRYITHPIADGAAVYRITAATGASATIEKVDIGDAWTIPAWGARARLSRKKVEGFLHQRDAMAEMFAGRGNWWAKQKVGSTLHYDNGFQQYVRGTVIEKDGKKMLKPTALVGDGWRKSDLWTRYATGEVSYGYHVKKIQEGEAWQPSDSCVFECPDRTPRNREDPRTMAPRALSPPPMTAEEEELAEVALLHRAIMEALKVEHRAPHGSDPVETRQGYLAAIAAAQALISSRADLFHGEDGTPAPGPR